MYQIKVIKRIALPSRADAGETEKISRAAVKPQAGKVAENWIDEWRASQPKDSRQAFAALFGNSPSASV